MVLLFSAAAAQALETYSLPLRSRAGGVVACSAQNVGASKVSVRARLHEAGAVIADATALVGPGQTVEILARTDDVQGAYCQFSTDVEAQNVRGFIHLRSVFGGDSRHVLVATSASGPAFGAVQTVTAPVRNIAGYLATCRVQNLSSETVAVTGELLDADGQVLDSDTDMVAPGTVRSVGSGANQLVAYCRFSFAGNPNAVRGFITTFAALDLGETILLYAASLPAGLTRSIAVTPPFNSPEGHATVCQVHNLDFAPIDVTASLIDTYGTVLDSGTTTVGPDEVRTVAGHTELSQTAVCRFDFSRSGSTARGYIMQYPPGTFADTRVLAQAVALGLPSPERVTTITPPLRSLDGTMICSVLNLSEDDVEVLVAMDDSSGVFVGLEQTIDVPSGRAKSGVATTYDSPDAYCRFTFVGRPDAVRGFAALQVSSPSRTKLMLPALALGREVVMPTATRTANATTTGTATRTRTTTPTATRSATTTGTATATTTATPTAGETHAATATATPSATDVAEPTVTATATAAELTGCAGDCDGSGEVSVEEIVLLVNIAAGHRLAVECPAGDRNADGLVTVEEIVVAVANLLGACP